MGGKDSASFSYFRELCVQGFLEARKPSNTQVASSRICVSSFRVSSCSSAPLAAALQLSPRVFVLVYARAW